MSQPESATSKRRLTGREREAQAIELRKEGYTYQEIADTLGYRSPSGARDAILRAMKRLLPAENVEEVRSMEVARLDAIMRRLWKKLKPEAFGKDELLVVDRILKVMDRRARLYGLDAPERQIVIEGDLETFLSRLPEEHQNAIRALIIAEFVGGSAPGA